ncbi:MAG: MoxR family ATPase, partial [Sulfurimonas sp.]|nr:MoxR family ATPase [Sulfurimonas sp.]
DLEIIKEEIKNIHIDTELKEYIVQLIVATRETPQYIEYGASPRATIDMLKAVKARAYLRGNDYVMPSDIVLCAKDILRHRIKLTYEAIADEMTPDKVIEALLQSVRVP